MCVPYKAPYKRPQCHYLRVLEYKELVIVSLMSCPLATTLIQTFHSFQQDRDQQTVRPEVQI